MVNKVMIFIVIFILFGCDQYPDGGSISSSDKMRMFKDDSNSVICYQAINNSAAFDCVKISRGE